MSVATAPEGIGTSVSNVLTIVRRNLLHIKSDPKQLVGMTIQSLMFLLLFVYVFGGAIYSSSSEYLQFALPSILVQGIATRRIRWCAPSSGMVVLPAIFAPLAILRYRRRI
jgi:hypothetical protein